MYSRRAGTLFGTLPAASTLQLNLQRKDLSIMDSRDHWENVYSTRTPAQMSWFRPHLEISLDLIDRAATDRSAPIIDVGGGQSPLVDDLLARGCANITVLDISTTAIDHARKRLGPASERVTWLDQDILSAALPPAHYDVWHDRAVFHFLTGAEERLAYVRQVTAAVKRGGHIIIGTFGPQGPERCSGLPTMRYDHDSLLAEFGSRFRRVDSAYELHQTPSGATQQFLYCHCMLI